MTTGDRIKQRRKELGYSAEYVAEKLGVSPATIYRYENGDIENFPTTILEPVARILNTTPAYLMGIEDNLDSDTDIIAKLYKDSELISHIELLLKLDANDRRAIYEFAEFMAKKKGL